MKLMSAMLAGVTAFSTLPAMRGEDVTSQNENPLLTRAVVVKQAVETRQREYVTARDALFKVLDGAVAHIPAAPTDFTAERAALGNFREIIHSLREEGERVQAAQSQFLETAHNYHRELPAAADVFDQIATQFTEYQREEPYEDHRRDYTHSAVIFQQLAVRCRAGIQELEPEIARVTVNVPYLERSLLFLTRMDQALETVPEFQAGAEYDRLLAQLKNYVTGYERMRTSLRGFHDQLNPSPSASPPATTVANDKVVLLPAQPGLNGEARWTYPAVEMPPSHFLVRRGGSQIGIIEIHPASASDRYRAAYLASYKGLPISTGDVVSDPRR